MKRVLHYRGYVLYITDEETVNIYLGQQWRDLGRRFGDVEWEADDLDEAKQWIDGEKGKTEVSA